METRVHDRVLIIAYGNPSRSDDGFGWRVADLLRLKLRDSKADIVCTYQLTPELASAARAADLLIFLDAAYGSRPGQITCADAFPHSEPLRFSHQLTPEQILAFSLELYGVRPRAYTISVTGESFEHGEELSEPVRSALPACVDIAYELIQQHAKPDGTAKGAVPCSVGHCGGREAETA
jgi:hydrogenase maturation protease